MRLSHIALLAGLLFSAQSEVAWSSGSEIGYPSFSDDKIDTESQLKSTNRRRVNAKSDKNLLPYRFGVGLGFNFPDILPIEGYFFASKFLAVRAFLVPTIPFNIRVELPRDEISSKGGVIIEHPDLNIKFKAEYGPQFGAEALFFPWQGSFYVSAGASYRKLKIVGGVESTLLISSQLGGPTVETNTAFSLTADATTSQWVARTALGWMWESFGGSYCNVTLLGLTIPQSTSSSINVDANIRNPAIENTPELTAALKEVKAKKEEELEEKALEEMKPVEKLILPVVGIAFGIYF